MKSGACPKCKKRNVSRCQTLHDRVHRSEVEVAAEPTPPTSVSAGNMFGGLGDRLRERHLETGATRTPQATTVVEHRLETAWIRYTCGDCYYVETYLDASDFPNELETYEGWERVSPPAEGPFR